MHIHLMINDASSEIIVIINVDRTVGGNFCLLLKLFTPKDKCRLLTIQLNNKENNKKKHSNLVLKARVDRRLKLCYFSSSMGKYLQPMLFSLIIMR